MTTQEIKKEMKDLTPDQLKAVDLVELAGYRVVLGLFGNFKVMDGDKMLVGYTSRLELTPSKMMEDIKRLSYGHGYRKGREDLQKELSGLLNN